MEREFCPTHSVIKTLMHSSLYLPVFGHRFVLTNADHYVLKYLESISGQIPSQTLDSLRQKLGAEMASKKAVEENGNHQFLTLQILQLCLLWLPSIH